MGVNVRFTVAIIAIIIIGFGGSFYIFSSGLVDGIKISAFDKSKYIEKIDECIDSQTAGHISLNSFALSLAETLKKQIEETEDENTAKEILAKLYDVTSCGP